MRFLGLILLFLSTAFPQKKSCKTGDEAQRFFGEIDSIHEWSELRNHHSSYEFGCDDGAFAELYSDKVATLFVKKPEAFFDTTLLNDSTFVRFILLHIDETWPLVDFQKVRSKIKKVCPKNQKMLCKDLSSKFEFLSKQNSRP